MKENRKPTLVDKLQSFVVIAFSMLRDANKGSMIYFYLKNIVFCCLADCMAASRISTAMRLMVNP